MTPTRHDEVELVFEQVLDQPAAEQATILRRLCGHDPDLLREVEALLANWQRADEEGFLLAPTDPPTAAPTPFPVVPGYEILELAGRGTTGLVYRARQRSLGRGVAMKVLAAGPLVDPSTRRRFQHEAELMGRISHPGIVAVYEVHAGADLPFLTMEWCPGGTLADRLNGRPLAPAEAVPLLVDLADAVEWAHQRGVVHRDLKPSNVLFDGGGRAKVADFGAARLCDDVRLTQSGTMLGTPQYMAPERFRPSPGRPDPRSDVYSLGAILYECLTGRPPFEGHTPYDLVVRLEKDEPTPPRRTNRRVPRDLETVCLKCLEKDPRRRYQTAQALADELRRVQTGEPIHARPVTRLARLVNWSGRYPGVALLIALLVLALLVAGGACGWAVNLAQAHAAARREKNDLVKDARRMVLALSQITRPGLHQGLMPEQVEVTKVHEEVAARCRALLRTHPDDTDLRALLAQTTTNLGAAKHTQDRLDEAAADLQEARQLWIGLWREDETNLERPRHLMVSLSHLYQIYVKQGLTAPREIGQEMLATSESIAARSGNPDDRYDVASVRTMLAPWLWESGSADEARQLLERNLKELPTLPPPSNPPVLSFYGATWQALGELHAASGRAEEARRCRLRARAEYRKLPDSVTNCSHLGGCCLALCREPGPDQQRYAKEAIEAFESMVRIAQSQFELDPENGFRRYQLAVAFWSQGQGYEVLGQSQSAAEAYQKTAEAYRRIRNPRPDAEDSWPDDRRWFWEFGKQLYHVALMQDKAGLAAEGQATRQRLGSIVSARLRALLASGQRDEDAAALLASLSALARHADQPELALQAAEVERDLCLVLVAKDPQRLARHLCLAEAYTQVCKSCARLHRHEEQLQAARCAVAEVRFVYQREPSASHATLVKERCGRLVKTLRERGLEPEARTAERERDVLLGAQS